MEKIVIKELDLKRFNALAGYSRSPAASYISQELKWFSSTDETIIGVILLDTIDRDYVCVVLGRDESGKFRAFDVSSGMEDIEEATIWIEGAIRWNAGENNKIFSQGDETQSFDLFSSVVPVERQNPFFVTLNSSKAFIPAKKIITEIMPHFVDIDGNFVEQFQSSGFDSRLWELYLYSYFTEEQLFIDRKHNAPDFIVRKYDQEVAIEAVIVGRKPSNPPKYFKEFNGPKLPNDILEEQANLMPIKFGSPLYTKLKKEYWKLPHVKGNPIALAIADFHDDQSMLWSSTPLINYLYGVRHDFYYDDKEKLIINPIKIDSHKRGNKEIPSGFFFQENAENISAVIFSASGTISKFNRLGRQAGFKTESVYMIRQGTCHDHNPNSSTPKFFRYEVDENSNETWSEGLSMFHNPNAIHPIPKELFPSIAHHEFQDGQVVSLLPEFHPYASYTYNIIASK